MNVLNTGEARFDDVIMYPPKSWKDFFSEIKSDLEVIEIQLQEQDYLPPIENIFTVFYLTSFRKIKVVILGQDPYYTPGYAHGLAFSCKAKTIPDSLQNIYTVLEKTVQGFKAPKHGDLTSWAVQGVFLVNTALTVIEKKPKSHKKIWENFTLALMDHLSQKKNIVYILWGGDAQYFERYINAKENKILKTSHPSPMSAHLGFMDCNHFNEANKYLEEKEKKKINWHL